MDFGGINKQTLYYVLPDKATKSCKYYCPDCNKDLILCKGKIKNPYFRHKVDKNDPCKYYTNPTETQIHKDAKLRLKELIKTKNIKVNRYCYNCKKTKKYSIPEFCEKSKICIEHKFIYNESNKFADVAYLKDDEIIQIYEICQTNKTKEKNRPEPWFEFNAMDIIELSKKEDNNLKINCLRDKNCNNCTYMNNLKNTNLEKWIRIKLGQDYKIPKKYENYSSEVIITKEEYDKLNNEEKKEFYEQRPEHKRFNYDAKDSSNKDICDIFADDLNTNRIVVYSNKGIISGYIISNKDYKKNNYWSDKYTKYEGANGDLSLPHLYIYDGTDGKSYQKLEKEGTIGLLMHLVKESLKFTPNNGCNYVNCKS